MSKIVLLLVGLGAGYISRDYQLKRTYAKEHEEYLVKDAKWQKYFIVWEQTHKENK